MQLFQRLLPILSVMPARAFLFWVSDMSRRARLAGKAVAGCLTVLLFLCGCALAPTPPAGERNAGGQEAGSQIISNYPALPADLPRARVAEVVDGDTLVVEIEGQERATVRLIGVDTPETVHPSRPVECFGKEASAKTAELLTGQTVLLEEDRSQDSRDRFGRLLRYVWLADGRLVNLELIAQGYAYEYTYERPYVYQAQFRAAQRQAQDTQAGLWSPVTCGGQARPAGAPSATQPSPLPPTAVGVLGQNEALEPSFNDCKADPNAERAPNAPVRIVAVDKAGEVVTLQNVSDAPIDLTGWRMCSITGSQRHDIGGALAPGETKEFRHRGRNIWSNSARDNGALYDAEGRLISYWRDG